MVISVCIKIISEVSFIKMGRGDRSMSKSSSIIIDDIGSDRLQDLFNTAKSHQKVGQKGERRRINQCDLNWCVDIVRHNIMPLYGSEINAIGRHAVFIFAGKKTIIYKLLLKVENACNVTRKESEWPCKG
ncbi:unnamed protein product [Brugia pahangi]|uniref:Histone domain-containing protein n=1 Tax=Brugia pahangi TaxID=6280 RepID=A0A0N4TI55_BRUPA|nr:unnamed protein product [Brugia pahangi]